MYARIALMSYHLEIINSSVDSSCHFFPLLRGLRTGVQRCPKPNIKILVKYMNMEYINFKNMSNTHYTIKSLGWIRFFFKEINTLIQQECIILIKSNKIMTQRFPFQINALLLNPEKCIMVSINICTTISNIDNNKKCLNFGFLINIFKYILNCNNISQDYCPVF